MAKLGHPRTRKQLLRERATKARERAEATPKAVVVKGYRRQTAGEKVDAALRGCR